MITIKKSCHGRKITIVGLEAHDILAAVRGMQNLAETDAEGSITYLWPLGPNDTVESIEQTVGEAIGKLPPKIMKATPAETQAVNGTNRIITEG